jgi:ribosome biogenesis protein Nip4
MIKPITDVVKLFDADVTFDESSIVKIRHGYFLLDANLKRLVKTDFFYAGTRLGEVRNNEFFPSFSLLRMIAEADANKIIVDERTEWLFTCGRDIFRKGIIRVKGSMKQGNHVLVLNQHGECLGYGKIVRGLNSGANEVVVENILDVGDFLRRER